MLVTEVLAELGYAAIESADGARALQVLRSDARIDLLVTDVGLPSGMNGPQLADSGRTARPALKILFITGYAEKAVMGARGLDEGMAILTKPFAMDGLAARIKELLLLERVSANGRRVTHCRQEKVREKQCSIAGREAARCCGPHSITAHYANLAICSKLGVGFGDEIRDSIFTGE
jgi:CheY-like chemotaxis protein